MPPAFEAAADLFSDPSAHNAAVHWN
jgi:hypothetical protein